ncbi:hypothetical protein [Vibrio mytili]|uniref:hypothetical protein n=1 Tax=Vibrio mytili TaxID=50718 RepID=UPI001008118F|nr:hypothetical protein [Vibrio mytili]
MYERIAVLNHEVERQLFGKYYIYQNLGSWFVECFLPSDLAERFDHTDEIYELNLQGNEGKSRKHREDAALLAHLLRWWTSRGNPIETWNQKDNHLVEFLASTTGRAYETITDILKTVKPNPKPKIPEEYENLDVFSSQIYSANPACQPTKEQVRNYKLVKNDNDVKKLESLLSNIPNNYKGNFTNFFP